MTAPYDPGLGVELVGDPIGLRFAPDVRHPTVELRRLDDVRLTLRDPDATGPDVLYAIAMDVCVRSDHARLVDQNLLFGVCGYSAGLVGDEPVRSQGHVHAVSASCGSSTGELYEFWTGRGIVYMQEHTGADPGRCSAITAGPGDKVLVPPGWAHLTVNADPSQAMAFGAWCVRDFGFDYAAIRERRGLAWYPVLDGDRIGWHRNPAYRDTALIEKSSTGHRAVGVGDDPIYLQWRRRPRMFDFIPRPATAGRLWHDYVP